MPIHNEEDNLRYSLPSIFALEPDEIVVLLDRCTDGSRAFISYAVKKLGYQGGLRLIEVDSNFPGWSFRVARLFRMGYEEARNDVILTTAADVILDPRIVNYVDPVIFSKVKLVSFGLRFYPIDFTYFAKRLVTLVFRERGFSGVFLFSREAWRETEDFEAVKKIIKAQDTFLAESIRKRYPTRHVWLNVVHLRIRKDPSDQYLRGVMSFRMGRKSTVSILASSILYLSPMMLKGYLDARAKSTNQFGS